MKEEWKNIEGWKNIKGFPDYQISNQGRVKSFKRRKPIILKTALSGGFEYVSLHKNKKIYPLLIHILVLENFICKRPKGKVGIHKDGNKLNNKMSNLKWVDHRVPIINAVKSGKIILSKNEIIERFHKGFFMYSNNCYNIEYKYKLIKKYNKKEKPNHKIIIKEVKKYNCDFQKTAKKLNVSREWIRQVITKCGYVVIKLLLIDNEICAERVVKGKGKVKGSKWVKYKGLDIKKTIKNNDYYYTE